MTDNTDEKQCPQCKSFEWDWANVGVPNAVQCCDCGYVYSSEPSPLLQDTYFEGEQPLDSFPSIRGSK
jgi:Zn ribbon nucleic-acid-binding protein